MTTGMWMSVNILGKSRPEPSLPRRSPAAGTMGGMSTPGGGWVCPGYFYLLAHSLEPRADQTRTYSTGPASTSSMQFSHGPCSFGPCPRTYWTPLAHRCLVPIGGKLWPLSLSFQPTRLQIRTEEPAQKESRISTRKWRRGWQGGRRGLSGDGAREEAIYSPHLPLANPTEQTRVLAAHVSSGRDLSI